MSSGYRLQITALIDFFGFSDEDFSNDNRMEKILEILKTLASLRSQGEFSRPFPGAIRINPIISTWSDHIAISYPLEEILGLVNDKEASAASIVFHSIVQIAGSIAASALERGILIRGGVGLGKLYHEDEVIFGESLIDAYRSESRDAVYPRIVVSHNVLLRPVWKNAVAPTLHEDFDGTKYLNYIPYVFSTIYGSTNLRVLSASAWFARRRKEIQEQINRLTKAGRLREAAKWRWFQQHLATNASRNEQWFPGVSG